MRKMDRVSTVLLTGMLATVSCAIAPAPPSGEGIALHASGGTEPGAASLAAEFARIARTLRKWETGLGPAERERLAQMIAREARSAGLPTALVLAVIEVESSGRNFAVSEAGALGLMQLLPTTGAFVAQNANLPWRGPETLFDPVANVQLGIRYLEHLNRKYPDLRTALAAYNFGPGSIAGRLERGESLPREYVDRVFAAWSEAGRET